MTTSRPDTPAGGRAPVVRVGLTAYLGIVLLSCGGGDGAAPTAAPPSTPPTPPPTVTSLEVSGTGVLTSIGDTAQFMVTARLSDGTMQAVEAAEADRRNGIGGFINDTLDGAPLIRPEPKDPAGVLDRGRSTPASARGLVINEEQWRAFSAPLLCVAVALTLASPARPSVRRRTNPMDRGIPCGLPKRMTANQRKNPNRDDAVLPQVVEALGEDRTAEGEA